MRRIRSQLVRLLFSAQMAASAIFSKPLRSGLTILGVTIGVASVVSLMSISEGAREAVVAQFESLGTNVVTIEAQDESITFDPEQAAELKERVQSLVGVTPVVETEEVLRWRADTHRVEILGVNSEFPGIRDHTIRAGNFFNELQVEHRSPAAVLGYNLAVKLAGGRNPVGQSITIGGQTFRVIGVLEQKGEDMADNIDDKVVIPYTTALKIEGERTVKAFWSKADSVVGANLAEVQLGRIFTRQVGSQTLRPKTPDLGGNGSPEMEKKPVAPDMPVAPPEEPGEGENGEEEEDVMAKDPEDLVAITNMNQLVDEVDQTNRIMSLMLGGIAAVSLLVGGLGIMNIMLVAVTERTREIGVRRAMGARKGDLIIQFLLEALYLSAIGSVIGCLLGVWGIGIFGQYGFETLVSFQAIQIAVGVALICGLVFGVYPAFSAASVPPAEALRR